MACTCCSISAIRERALTFGLYPRMAAAQQWPSPPHGLTNNARQFSPDGRWVAYQSDESGREEIYIQPYPATGATKWTISPSGGTQVRWRRDGREILLYSMDGGLMAVPVALTMPGGTPDIASPVALFAPPVGGFFRQGDARHQYAVSSDGQRFLVATITEPTNVPITVVLNWKPGTPRSGQ